MPAEAKHVNNMVTVTTLFWQDPVRMRRRNYDFKLEQILIWRNMIARNLTLPHEFVCIIGTMDQAGMVDLDALAAELRREGIRPVPLDKSKHVPGTVFVRLMLRRPDIGGILGPRIFMTDLDVVIVANIDSIVDRPEDSVWWRNPNYEPGGRRAYIQSSVQLFDAGARSFLYTEFDPQITPTWVNRRFGAAEQAWFAERLKWQDEAFWTEDDGIYGAMRLGDSADGAGKELPPNAKIISCPGQRAPWQEEMQKSHPWIAEHYR